MAGRSTHSLAGMTTSLTAADHLKIARRIDLWTVVGMALGAVVAYLGTTQSSLLLVLAGAAIFGFSIVVGATIRLTYWRHLSLFRRIALAGFAASGFAMIYWAIEVAKRYAS